MENRTNKNTTEPNFPSCLKIMNVKVGENLESCVFHVYVGVDPMWKWLVDLGSVKLTNTGRSQLLYLGILLLETPLKNHDSLL